VDKQTEIYKLLHFLQVENNADYDFLEKLSAEDLQKLRLQVIEVAQIEQADIWKRLAGVAKFMPSFMNAKVAETVLGPLIAANMSYYMPERDAIAIMKHMSTNFLATVSEFMVPEKAKHLLNAIPMDIMKKVTVRVIAQKKYLTAAGFVDVLEMSRLIELSKVIEQEEDLIRISMYVENKPYVAKIVEGYTLDRLLKIIEKAYKLELQEEVLRVFEHLDSPQVKRVLGIVNSMPEYIKENVLQDFEGRIGKK
jgi:hypothetical protein